MTPREKRSSLALAGIFALRMLGLFVILPVFAVYAHQLPGGENEFLVGVTLGIYGLTQGVLQIPFGSASDKYGRKPVIIAGLLIFAAGSFLAAFADDIWLTLIGRAIQGAGAISAAVTAFISDAVRETVLTKAMAMVGASIGLTFALSLVISPPLARFFGVDGLHGLYGRYDRDLVLDRAAAEDDADIGLSVLVHIRCVSIRLAAALFNRLYMLPCIVCDPPHVSANGTSLGGRSRRG